MFYIMELLYQIDLDVQVFIGTEKGLSILNQTNRMEEYV